MIIGALVILEWHFPIIRLELTGGALVIITETLPGPILIPRGTPVGIYGADLLRVWSNQPNVITEDITVPPDDFLFLTYVCQVTGGT